MPVAKKSVTVSLSSVLGELLDGLPVTIEGMGLSVAKEANSAQKKEIGKRLSDFVNQGTKLSRFCLGDWYNSLPDGYGQRKALCIEYLGEHLADQARQAAWVASRWIPGYRKEGLPWEFYKMTARLDLFYRRHYLQEWQKGKWAVKSLREELKTKFPSQHCVDNNIGLDTIINTVQDEDCGDVNTISEGDTSMLVLWEASTRSHVLQFGRFRKRLPTLSEISTLEATNEEATYFVLGEFSLDAMLNAAQTQLILEELDNE
jgi:hypothetical protein